MKTTFAKKGEVERKWYLIDAEGETLGRLSSVIAHILRGKHKPIYTPHIDTGDFVIVINADKLKIPEKKLDNKLYYHHSLYPGGLKVKTLRTILETNPAFIIKHAVKGMLPKNKLGRKLLKKLKVYAGNEHPHNAQKPVKIKIKYNKTFEVVE